MDRYSLLGHVAPGVTSQVENLATESLLYLLHRYRWVHESFEGMASSIGRNNLHGLSFDTQASMSDAARPDLRGTKTDGRSVLLVEVKFWAQLTPNQPVNYLRLLPSESGGMVLFMAPEARFETLWSELVLRCVAGGIELKGSEEQPPRFRSADSDFGMLSLVSWAFVLDFVRDHLLDSEQEQAAYEVW